MIPAKSNSKYDSTNEEIERLVPPRAKVLDIGCTTGKMAKNLNKKDCTVVGIDIDKESLKIARKHCFKTICIDLDDSDLLSKSLGREQFDIIILGDVIEHLKQPGKLLKVLRKNIGKDSLVICSVPNSAFIWMRARFMLGKLDYSKHGGLMDEGHLRFFSFKTAKNLFRESGFRICYTKPSSHGINSWIFYPIKLLAQIIPTVFAIHILIIAQKS